MCSCLCFCSWCVAIIICNWNLFKLLSAIFSSCVLFLCAGDERNGHKATWEHLLRVTINIPLSLFIFFSFTPQQVWEYLLRVTSHWHCLSSFAFAHQQVYLLLLLLSHINKSISFTFTFTLNQVYQIDFIRRQSFYREEEEASVSSLLAEDSSKASPRGQVIKQFQSNMTDPVHTSYLSRTPRTYLCKFFLAGVNFYRFNAKNWHFRQILREQVAFFTDLTRKIGVFRCKFYSPKILLV